VTTAKNVLSRLAAAIGVAILSLFALVAVAPAAFAHHPEISFTVHCGHAVEWTAQSWKPGTVEGSNPDITVDYRLDGGAWQAVPNGQGAFTIQQPSFGGSFTAPGNPVSVQLRVTANAKWDNGQAGGQVVTADKQDFPTDCGRAEPYAGATLDCAEGGVAVTIGNEGTKAVTVDVLADGVIVHDDVVVDPGAPPLTRYVPVDEDTTVTISVVTVDGEGIYYGTITRDCEEARTTPPPPPPPEDPAPPPPAEITPPPTTVPAPPAPQPVRSSPVTPSPKATPTPAPVAAATPLAVTGPSSTTVHLLAAVGLLTVGALLVAGGRLARRAARPA
jgi:hypothetical protein